MPAKAVVKGFRHFPNFPRMRPAMRVCSTRPWAVLFAICAAGVALGDEPQTGEQWSLADGELQVFAHRVYQITEVVLDNHIEPPTRQEMLLCGLTALYGDDAPAGLSRAVSDVAKEGDFIKCLIQFWPKASGNPGLSAAEANPSSDEPMRMRFLAGMSFAVPGGLKFMSGKEAAVEKQLAANQYVGIGIHLTKANNANRYQIHDTFPRGAAAKAGIEDRELLLEVDGAPTDTLSLREVVDRLRGPEGSTVTVKVAREAKSEPRLLTLTRSVVPRQTVVGYRQLGPEKWETMIEGAVPVACLNIREIAGSTVAELREYEATLAAEHVNFLILDLRLANGRELRHAIALADALLDGGSLGHVRSREGSRSVQLERDSLFRDWTMAVLVSEYTHGFAEWVAGALQTRRRAIVVGEPTKGGERQVLTAVDLPDNLGMVRLATAVLDRDTAATTPGFLPSSTAEDDPAPPQLKRLESPLFRLHAAIRAQFDQRHGVTPDLVVDLRPEGPPDPQRWQQQRELIESRLLTRTIEALMRPAKGAQEKQQEP
jgi:C-terminal peptidase prc